MMNRPLKKLTFGLVIGCAVLLISCKKEDTNNPPQPVSGVSVYNLASGHIANIGVAFSNMPLTQTGIVYGSAIAYTPILSSQYTISAYNFNDRRAFTSSSTTFTENKLYSIFITGKDSSNYANTIAEDKLDSIPYNAGKSYIRFLNALADSAKIHINITEGSNNIINDSVDYRFISNFLEVSAGKDIIFNINLGDTAFSRTIQFPENQSFTVFGMGQRAATDTSRTARIRYFNNGEKAAE